MDLGKFHFSGLTESNLDEALPQEQEGELRLVNHRIEQEGARTRLRRRVSGVTLVVTAAGAVVGLIYGAAARDYEPLLHWLAFIGPPAGYVLQMVLEGRD